MKKGELCIRIISVRGSETATIERVERVTRSGIIIDDSRLVYAAVAPHVELDPQLPGCSSRLVPFDDGEAALWGLK